MQVTVASLSEVRFLPMGRGFNPDHVNLVFLCASAIYYFSKSGYIKTNACIFPLAMCQQ